MASEMMMIWRLTTLFLLFPSISATNRPPLGQNLIVLLIDGYGAELFNRTNARIQGGTQTLISNGVQAEYLKPVFPTQSYPNWFSLATGLYVENHNFTSDFMYNEESDVLFQRDEGENDTDYRWWITGSQPIWYTIGKADIDIHCYWFSHCHRPHGDMIVHVPHERRHSFKEQQNIDLLSHLPKMLKHIKKYQPYKQQLILMRYNGVANALRLHGEDSAVTSQALNQADQLVQKLQDEMDTHGLLDSTNLIVLSDHGLLKVDEEEQFYLEECLSDLSRVKRVANSLAMMQVFPAEGEEDTVFFELKTCDQWAPLGDYDGEESQLVNVYRAHEIPERFHWKNARFLAPIVIFTKPGTILLTRQQIPSTDVSEADGRKFKMASGWDNENPAMQGFFLARGPAFKENVQVEPLETVDVYQLILNIMGVQPPHEHNGTWANVEDMLADGWEMRSTESQSFAQRNTFNWLSFSIMLIISFLLYA
uniref:Uncharacterized protein n=1 Tax=Acrobeloides nanus TaxID=290746 RepID=A0A914DAD2_9BILA